MKEQAQTVMSHPCPVCGRDESRLFFEIAGAPVFCNVLWPSRTEALAAPQAPIRLGYCDRCGLIRNLAFEPARVAYSPAYENSLHCSREFQGYAAALAAELVRNHGLRGRTVVEIGCGQGEFLGMLRRAGAGRAVGFDPAYDPARDPRGGGGDADVTIHNAPFDPARLTVPADCICCRHVLEHIPGPVEFLDAVGRALHGRREALAYFETPNALHTLQRLGVWDIIYEHCNYFTPTALENAFLQAGFRPLGTREVYGGQFVALEARMEGRTAGSSPGRVPPGDMAPLVDGFAEAYRRRRDAWSRRLREIHRSGARVAIWGAGSKGACFLNALGITADAVPYAVDINPRKHGRFIPGTGQEVVPPSRLRDYRPETLIVMNPIYGPEIRRTLRQLSVEAELAFA